ncbi:MAG: hypothetical protein ACM3S0_07255 [Acidobacteriota bacterium]
MFGSTIVDVAIGLIFIFFLLSVIASHINELISGWMNWRAKDLEQGVRHLLCDPTLADKVWNHPLVRGVSGKAGRPPAYIPSNTFALAVFDALLPGGNNPTALQSVRAKALELPENTSREALVSIIDAANGDMTLARSNVESWFDSAMERVSAEFKRRMQILTLGVSLVVTLVFGADTIAIANSLYQEPSLRAAVSGVAANQGSAGATQPPTTIAAGAGQNSNLQQTIETLQQQNLPLGWNKVPQTGSEWIFKIIGLVLTSLAVSLGAPFWYQLLKSLASARSSTGPSPQKV